MPQNSLLGEKFLNTGIGQVAADVSRELPQGSGGSCLERPAECFVAPAAAQGTRWGPATGAGPLGEQVANTFRGGSYTETVLTQETTLDRAYGGSAGRLGSYWSRTAPTGPLQATMDSALNPAWGNTAQNVATIRVPAGTTIYEGAVAPQGNLLGGGSQVVIPKVNPNWLVPTP